MQTPLQITFRGMDPSPTIEAQIRERASRLERFRGDIVRCHVVVDVPHRHQTKGRLFSLRIDLSTPMGEVTVNRGPDSHAGHEDFKAVVRDAFDAMTRQLEEELRRRRAV
jgi:ribosome-associated translation inhibitor RaiA